LVTPGRDFPPNILAINPSPMTRRVASLGDNRGSDQRARQGGSKMCQLIYRAMHQPDDLVIEFDYTDAKGTLPGHGESIL
jgi:hypothetical protein